MDDNRFDIRQLLDTHPWNVYRFQVIVICFLVVLSEGYDIAVMAFAIPGLTQAWNLGSPAALGPVLSASLAGMMIGSALMGYLGDRFGRRWTIIISCILFAIFTGSILFAKDLQQLFVLRFLSGIGLGGAAPAAIALTSEFAPAKRRAMTVTVMFSGIGLGGALPGIAASLLEPSYGWVSLFLVGTIIPVFIIAVCLLWLPESPSYQIGHSRSEKALSTLSLLAPEALRGVSATQLVVENELRLTKVGVAELFRHNLAPKTILFWILTICNFMTFYFLQSWTPALLHMAHLPPAIASLGQAVFQLGGVTGGLVLGISLDKRGPIVMAAYMLASILPTAALSFAGGLAHGVLLGTEFAAGFCILGTAYGFSAIATMIYPNSIRSNGAGWGLAVGRLGGIVSTLIAGLLLARGLGLSDLFLLATCPLLLAAPACLLLARSQTRVPAFSGKKFQLPPDSAARPLTIKGDSNERKCYESNRERCRRSLV